MRSVLESPEAKVSSRSLWIATSGSGLPRRKPGERACIIPSLTRVLRRKHRSGSMNPPFSPRGRRCLGGADEGGATASHGVQSLGRSGDATPVVPLIQPAATFSHEGRRMLVITLLPCFDGAPQGAKDACRGLVRLSRDRHALRAATTLARRCTAVLSRRERRLPSDRPPPKTSFVVDDRSQVLSGVKAFSNKGLECSFGKRGTHERTHSPGPLNQGRARPPLAHSDLSGRLRAAGHSTGGSR